MLPEHVVLHILERSDLDIDTRRALDMPPRKIHASSHVAQHFARMCQRRSSCGRAHDHFGSRVLDSWTVLSQDVHVTVYMDKLHRLVMYFEARISSVRLLGVYVNCFSGDVMGRSFGVRAAFISGMILATGS
jgi:hypothetical protein